MPTGPGSYYQRFTFNAEVLGKENVDMLNRGLEISAQRLKASNELFISMSASMKNFTDRGLSASEALSQIKKNLDASDTAGRGFVNTLRKVLAELREIERQNRPQPGGGNGGGGGGVDYSNIFGRVGGRVGGALVLGKLGIPGGGFIGSQIAGSLGLSGAAAYGLAGVAGGAFAGYELIKHANDTLAYAQAQRNLANEIGITASQMDTLSRIGEITGIKLEGSAKAVSKLGTELAETGRRSHEIAAALSHLGLGTNVAYEEPSVAFNKIAEALAKIPDVAERSRIAVMLLGESAGRALAAASGSVEGLSEKLKVDNDTLERLAKAKDNINAIWEAVSRKFLISIDVVMNGWSRGGEAVTHVGLGKGELSDEEMESIMARLGGVAKPAPRAFVGPQVSYQKDAARKALVAARESFGTPEQRFSGKMENFKNEEMDLSTKLQNLEISPAEYNQQFGALRSREIAAEAEKRQEEATRRQVDDLRKMSPATDASLRSSTSMLESLLTKYPDAARSPEGRALLRSKINSSFKDVQAFQFMDWVRGHRTEYAGESMRVLQSDLDSEKLRDERILSDTRAAAFPISKDLGNDILAIHGVTGINEAGAGYNAALRSGGLASSKYSMTPAQAAAAEYANARAAIAEASSAKIAGLRAQGTAYSGASKMLGDLIDRTAFPDNDAGRAERARLTEEKARYDVEAAMKETEVRTAQTDALTKGVDATTRFNESVVKAAEQVRDQFSGGIASIIMGAQHGGKGASNAARGFLEGQETQLIQNAVGRLVYGDPNSKAGGVLNKIGGALPPWLTQGTILQHIDEKKPLNDNTKALEALTQALYQTRGMVGGGSGAGGFGGFGGGGGAVGDVLGGVDSQIAALSNLPINSPWAGAGGISLGSPYGGSSIAKAASPLQNIMGGFGAGMKLAGSKSFGILFGGQGATPAVKAGAIAGDAMAAIGMYEGISTMMKGSGAKSILNGLAGTLAAAGLFTGPAMPFVEAAAAVTGLVSSFLPDGRTTRANQIAKTMFTEQYLAPPAMNLSQSTNGGYADFDIFGNVRTSNLSPYPQAHLPYLDVPRRTVVPGSTYSQFGGPNNTASALTPPPIYNITIHAMDAKSILDRSHDIVDAFHKGIKSGPSDVVNTIGQHLGIRGA